MSRLFFAVIAAAIGLALHFSLGWRYLAFFAALGIYGVVDRLGWIPGPYRTPQDIRRNSDGPGAKPER